MGICSEHITRQQNAYNQELVFFHELGHRTTWILPQRNGSTDHHDGTLSRSQYRNQIYYIIIKNCQNVL